MALMEDTQLGSKISVSQKQWTLLLTHNMVKSESERLKGHILVRNEREKLVNMYGVIKDSMILSFRKDYEAAGLLCENVSSQVCSGLQSLELFDLSKRVKEVKRLYVMIIDLLMRKLASTPADAHPQNTIQPCGMEICVSCLKYKQEKRLQKIRERLEHSKVVYEQRHSEQQEDYVHPDDAKLEEQMESTLRKKPQVLRIESACLAEYLQSILNDHSQLVQLKRFQEKEMGQMVGFMKESKIAMEKILAEMGQAFRELKLTKIVPCLMEIMSDYNKYRKKADCKHPEVNHRGVQTVQISTSRVLQAKLREMEQHDELKKNLIDILEQDCLKLKRQLSNNTRQNQSELSEPPAIEDISGKDEPALKKLSSFAEERKRSVVKQKVRSKTMQKQLPKISKIQKPHHKSTIRTKQPKRGSLPRLERSQSTQQPQTMETNNQTRMDLLEVPPNEIHYENPVPLEEPNQQKESINQPLPPLTPTTPPQIMITVTGAPRESRQPMRTSSKRRLSDFGKHSLGFRRETTNPSRHTSQSPVKQRLATQQPIRESILQEDLNGHSQNSSVQLRPDSRKLVSFMGGIKQEDPNIPRPSILSKGPLKKQKINKRMMFKKLSIFGKEDLCRLFFSLSEAQHFQTSLKSSDVHLQDTSQPSELLTSIHQYIVGLKHSNPQIYNGVITFLTQPYTNVTTNLTSSRHFTELTLEQFNITISRILAMHRGCNKSGTFCSHMNDLLSKIGYSQRRDSAPLRL